MIVGLGLDVVELSRIERMLEKHPERFLARILTPAERDAMPEHTPVPYVAARFAAKEAAAKALGTGIAEGVGFQTMEVQREASGQPRLVLHGPAKDRARTLGADNAHITLTHGRDIAAAVVVLEKM
ncbi:holo-[acyl-carrier-protein] synthase [Desulfobaculum senezii]|jgi:holo-[acyl-carrier protein] synthase